MENDGRFNAGTSGIRLEQALPRGLDLFAREDEIGIIAIDASLTGAG